MTDSVIYNRQRLGSVDLRQTFIDARKAAGLSQAEAGIRLGVSSGTVSRKERGEIPVNPRDLAAIQQLARQKEAKGLDDTVPRETSSDDAWAPNPALRGLIPQRAYDVAIGYCRRLAQAGLPLAEIENLERVMIDSRYAKANKRIGRELPEDDWVLLVDDAWDAIRETLAGQGVRV
jgi:transcriptional regulator with XRE-family HTH domain